MSSESLATLELKVAITLNEQEVGALDALSGYGEDAFVKHFYDHLGESYMAEYEQGLRSFLRSVRGLGVYINRAKKARAVLNGGHV